MSSTVKAVYYTINKNTKTLYRAEYDEFGIEKFFDYLPHCIGGTSENDLYVVGGPPPVIYKRNPNGSWSEIVSSFKTSYPTRYFNSLYIIGPENFALTLYEEKELIFYNSGSFINYILPEKVYSYDGEYAICDYPTKARYFSGSSWEPVPDARLGSYRCDYHISPGNHLLAITSSGNLVVYDGITNSSSIIHTELGFGTTTSSYPNIWANSGGRIVVVCQDFVSANGFVLERKDSIWKNTRIGESGSIEHLYTLSVTNAGNPEEDCMIFSGPYLIVYKRPFGYVKQRLGVGGGNFSCAFVKSTYESTRRVFVGISGEYAPFVQHPLINYDGSYWLYAGLMTKYKISYNFNEEGHAGVDCIWGSDQNNVWIGSNNIYEQAVYKFDGSSFSKVLTVTPPWPDPPEKLYAAYGTSSTNVWIAGSKFYHYDGSWSDQIATGQDSDIIYGIVVFSDGKGVAAGTSGKAYLLSYGNWSVYANGSSHIDPAEGDLNAVWGSDSTHVWVGGQNGLWFWNSSSWVKITAERPYGDRAIYSIHGTSSSNVWFGLENGKLEHWNGLVFTEYSLNGASEGTIKSINMIHEGLGYAVGSYNSTWGGGLISEWNGSQWQGPSNTGDKNRSVDISSVWGFPLGTNNPPNLQNLDPYNGETDVAVEDNVILEIVDPENDLQESSVSIGVDGLLAWSSSSQQPGFTVNRTSITNGYRYEINPDFSFDYLKEIIVDIYALDSVSNIMDTSYSFTTIDSAPKLRNQDPYPNEMYVALDAYVSLEIYDDLVELNASSVIIKINGDTAWQSLSQQPGFSVVTTEVSDGYKYEINPDVDFEYDDIVPVYVYALNSIGKLLEVTYSFKVIETPVINDITIINRFPVPNAIDVDSNTLISCDILSQNGINESSIEVKIDGLTVFNDLEFIYPFNGPNSELSIITVVIGITTYYGFHLVIDNQSRFSDIVLVNVYAENTVGDHIDDNWSFLIGTFLNSLYFSDSDGVKKINLKNLVGESQSEVKTILSTSSYPAIPSNIVSSMHGNMIDDIFCLALSFNNYGTYLVRNESELTIFSTGNSTYKSQITDNGILYLINKTNNSIEVYYGVHTRDGDRSPDFVYNSSSTPSVQGTILSLHVVSGVSTKFDGGTRLYIGTDKGLTRIETYDESIGGYSNNMDNQGIAITYGLPGSGTDYEVIGGSSSSVIAVSSDEENDIFFVVTQGISQISLQTHSRLFYLTYENGFLPSIEIRDIFGKAI